jgi:hypothetical protein
MNRIGKLSTLLDVFSETRGEEIRLLRARVYVATHDPVFEAKTVVLPGQLDHSHLDNYSHIDFWILHVSY